MRPEENIDDMSIVAATETLQRYILTLVPAWQNRPIMLQVALVPPVPTTVTRGANLTVLRRI